MSRVSKWKFEKTKVKVVFRLQFHATHIPLSGWDKLFISLIPSDAGKATAKTTKANVRNGTCKWADPIYETTRLLQDSKTKQYEEKLYKLVIAMGSSRSSILGEATINLADYTDALKPSVVSLPLCGCDSGTILHVTVQLLTSKTGFREFEQQRELRERGLQTDQNNLDEFSGGKVLLTEDAIHDQMDKGLFRVKFKDKLKDLAPLEEEIGPSKEYTELVIGFDGSSNTSESQYAEKHDTSSAHEIDSLKSTASGDLALYSVGQGPQQEKEDPSDLRFPVHGTSDWVQSWSSDYSADNDLAAAYEENCRLRGTLKVAESSIIELKLELSSLQNYADQIGLEAQKFDGQLAAEISSGEELAKEVSVLKSESSKLKVDLERLKVSKSCLPSSNRASVVEQDHMLKDLQLRWLKGLSILEDKIRQFQDKACLGYHERDFRFLHSDVEAIFAVLQNLKQGTELVTSGLSIAPSERSTLKESTEMSLHKSGQFVTGTGFDLDMYQPELGMLHCLSIPGLVSHGPDSVDSTNAMRGKIFELLRELDESKTEKESLAKKMDQMECYYEALVHELEENQRQMLGELQNLKNEYSTSLYLVSSTKAEMETICHGLNEQIVRLTEDKCNLISLSEELERRAMTAEAALKRARLNYSIAVDHLQKDLELLSSQVLSMFEASESLVRQAFADSLQPNFQGQIEREHMLKFDSEELSAAKLPQFPNQFTGFKKQQLGGDIFLGDLKKSLHMQEGLYRKVDDVVCEVHFMNVYLDVLSKTLQETLLQANEEIKLMNKKVNELFQQLELSTEAKELLMQKLQTADNDIHFLNECNATCVTKCNDMSQQNQKLEANVQVLTNENFILRQKVAECESLVVRCSHYESKYETCMEEKTELAYLLENKTLDNGDLQNEILTLQEELKGVRSEYDVLFSTEKNLQKFVNFLQNKLQNLLSSYERSIKGMLSLDESDCQDVESLELTDILINLEKLQHSASQRILQLIEEKESLLHEKDTALRALSTAESEITTAESEITLMKQKYELGIHNMVDKLDVSNALVQKLHKDMEAITRKLQLSFEVEEKHEQWCNELFSDLDQLEVELHEITSSNNGIAHEILVLETLTTELGKSNMTAAELMKENESFVESLQEKNEEVTKLASELRTMKESLLSLQDENQVLIMSSQYKEGESAQLASELNSLKVSLQSIHHENQALMASFQSKSEEAAKLASELNHSKESLQFVHDENKMLLVSLQAKTEESTKLILELDGLKKSLQSLHDEKQVLIMSLQDKSEESTNLASELQVLKEKLQSLHDENQVLMTYLQGKEEESAKVGSELEWLKESLRSLLEEKHALMLSSENKTKEVAELALELNNLKESLQCLHDENQSLLVFFHDKSEESAKLASELIRLREYLQSQQDENQALVVSSRGKTEESLQIALELDSLKEKLRSLHDELFKEKSLKEMLEHKIGELTLELGERESQLLQFKHCESELFHLNQLVLDLESEKSKLRHLLLHSDKCLKIACEESASISGLETQLIEMHELLVAADVNLVFIRVQYEGRLAELVTELYSSDRQMAELLKKQIDVELVLHKCLATEVQYMQENAGLLTRIDSLKPELEASIAENRLLLEASRVARAEFEEYKSRAQNMGISGCGDQCQYSSEVQRLNLKLVTSEEEVDDLMISKAELEVHMLVLKAKLEEQQEQIVLLEGCHDELVALQQQCDELTQKLSEQMLKTEELKNLSVHLKQLKDKADAECIQAREKREPEGPPFAGQESLRIAFIREQHETKLHELKQQLSISKKHSEEMLWKLQDALNEIESRKKSEASLLKKNEELGMNILDLEAELQLVLSDKREKVKAYDLMKAEMECSLISLECCKEEKQQLEILLQEAFEEKSRIEAELTLTKEQLEKVKPALTSAEKGKDGFCEEEGPLADEAVCRIFNQKSPTGDTLSPESKSADTVSLIGPSGDLWPRYLEQDSSKNLGEAENGCQATKCELDQAMTLTDVASDQVVLASFGENGLYSPTLPNEQKLLKGDVKHLALINDRFRAEGLRSSMDHLSNELEKMKNENSIVLQDDQGLEQKFPDLQSELVHLRKTNEELGSMFPLFNEFSRSGNALERVLALEIELAQALQTKKRSSFHFQSSFLKQHSDEEAIFKSFRDINELIKDMLEIKGRYSAMENELKDMHDRYSQLSLQFAEVEGERQKLMMTLKNVRTSKRSSLLNRSSSAVIGEHC